MREICIIYFIIKFNCILRWNFCNYKKYTKNEIITMYLNTVPFSGISFGIESASKEFFNKSPKNLQIEEAAAFSYIQGYLIANDVTIAHEKILRPPIKQKCRDSFCPMSEVVVASDIKNPNDFHISIYINDELKLQNSTKNLVRPIAKLLADITKFMTLNEGDVVLVGTPENLPLAQAGDKVSIEISCEGESIGRLVNFVQQESVSWNMRV